MQSFNLTVVITTDTGLDEEGQEIRITESDVKRVVREVLKKNLNAWLVSVVNAEEMPVS